MSPPPTIELEGDFDHVDVCRLNDALARWMRLDTKLPNWIIGMEGMSGRAESACGKSPVVIEND